MSGNAKAKLFRELPSTDEILRQPEIQRLSAREGHSAVTAAIRAVLDRLRREISDGHLDEQSLDLALANLPGVIDRQLRQFLDCSLRPVINATGVILHTNLGRAPLTANAFHHIREITLGYSNLEFDLVTGGRGKRDIHVDRLFQRLFNEDGATGVSPVQPDHAQTGLSTIVVNNNAAAVLLALNTLAEGGEVVVSRGELVEIGGSFRIPDVMLKSQATLREVGTTNRTHLSDYERAISERTRLLLRVHRSNFAVTGFTEQPALEELVALARRHKLPLMEDLGSGALFDLSSVGIANEPGVLDSLHAGVDLVTYSGDKLLGGPQAGLITGRAEMVARLRSNSLFRALRVDKLTYAALEATLLAYVKGDHDAVPVLRMMRCSKEEITGRAEALISQTNSAATDSNKLRMQVVDGESIVGGGAAPTAALPTSLMALAHGELGADDLCALLRHSNPPVIARVEEGRVLLDLRTVLPEQDSQVASILISMTA